MNSNGKETGIKQLPAAAAGDKVDESGVCMLENQNHN